MKLNSYAAIEIDSLYAKLIIAEMNKGNIHIIAALKGLVEGYEDGVIIDDEAFLTSILSLLQLADHKYKIKIDEIILVLPNISHKVRMAGANMAIQTPMHLISMNEIKKIRNDCRNVALNEMETAIDESPISYTLDSGKTLYSIPLNIQSNTLQLTSYIHTLPTDFLKPLLNLLDQTKVDIIEAYLLPLACYSMGLNDFNENQSYLFIHYNYDALSIAYFEKNQLLKSSRIAFGEKTILESLMKQFNITKLEAIDLLDSYFLCDVNQATSTYLDKVKKISEKTITECVLQSFEKGFEEIKKIVQEYSQTYHTNFEIKIMGKWLNYKNFLNYFNLSCQFNAQAVYLNVLGLTSNEFISTYGAIVRFVLLNKDYILHREEDDNQKKNFNYTSKESKQENKFVDIFDED